MDQNQQSQDKGEDEKNEEQIDENENSEEDTDSSIDDEFDFDQMEQELDNDDDESKNVEFQFENDDEEEKTHPLNIDNCDKRIRYISYPNQNSIEQDNKYTDPNDLQSILHSIANSQTETEKQEKASLFRKSVLNLNSDIIEKEIRSEVYKDLNNMIGDGSAEFQQTLIDSLLSLSECGASLAEEYKVNRLYEDFRDSGLIKTLETIIKQQIELSKKKDSAVNEEYSYSGLIVKVVQIYMFIKKVMKVNKDILEFCVKCISFQINSFVTFLKELQNKANENNGKLEIKKHEFINKVNEATQGLKAIKEFTQYWENKDIFVEQFQLHKIISPLLHILCSKQLKCKQRINLPYTQQVQELHGAAISALGELIHNDQGSKNGEDEQDVFSAFKDENKMFLFVKNVAFHHIADIIISFASNYQINQNLLIQNPSSALSTTNQISIMNQSPDIIEGALHLLYALIIDCQMLLILTAQTPGLGNALSIVTNYGRKWHYGKISQRKGREIRWRSNMCLWWISMFCFNDVKQQMVRQWRIFSAMVESVAVAGGSEEGSQHVYQSALEGICEIMGSVRSDDQMSPIQPILVKEVYEQAEEVGASEEIEAHLFIKRKYVELFTVRLNSMIVQQTMLNLDPRNAFRK